MKLVRWKKRFNGRDAGHEQELTNTEAEWYVSGGWAELVELDPKNAEPAVDKMIRRTPAKKGKKK